MKKAEQGQSLSLLGAISTKPGLLFGYDIKGVAVRPVALAGRIPVKVSMEGGPINIGDRIAVSSVPGVGMKSATSSATIGVALESYTTISASGKIMVFVDMAYSFAKEELYIDKEGRVGIGTTTPQYKLHVIGDVAAQSFVNISTRKAKKDIVSLSDADNESILEKIRNLTASRYYYNSEEADGLPRLGLIAEESPLEILSKGGKGVDLYKFTTFILSGFKALVKRVDDIFARVARVESIFSPDSSSTIVAKNFCVEDVCVSKEQFRALLQIQPQTTPSTPDETPNQPSDMEETPPADTQPPVITLNGNNPAVIQVGATYADLGATVTDNLNENLGYTISVDGGVAIDPSSLSLDTSAPATYTLTFKAIDQAGNVGTATRTVEVEAIEPPETTP